MLHRLGVECQGERGVNLNGLAHYWINPKPVPLFVHDDGRKTIRNPHLVLIWQGGARLELYDLEALQVIGLLIQMESREELVDEAELTRHRREDFENRRP